MAHKKTSYSAPERQAADKANRGAAKAEAVAEFEPNYSDDPEADLLDDEAPGYAVGGEV